MSTSAPRSLRAALSRGAGFRVARAVMVSELLDRIRDRWVLVATGLFALLSVGVTLYGSSVDDQSGMITAPSLVTLSAFLVPLVALVLGYDAIVGERERHTLGLLLSLPVSRTEVLVAKYLGRVAALAIAIGVGLGAAAILLDPGQRWTVLAMVWPTMLLGAAFLSVGTLLSVIAHRVATAASLAVVTWFLLVFFWDLGLLAAMLATDGALSQQAVSWLVSLNPAGLYRTGLMVDLLGQTSLEDLGLVVALPGTALRAAIWSGWILGPLALGSALLSLSRSVKS